MDSAEESGCLTAALFFAVIFAASAIVRTYVIFKLWAWYIVPAFHVPEMSMKTAFGISMLAGCLVPTITKTYSAKELGWGVVSGAVVELLIGALLVLLVGFAVSRL
jgi:hypothetical protein